MKWYFASRTRHKEIIDKLGEILKRNNHEIAYEWGIIYEWIKQESIKQSKSELPLECEDILLTQFYSKNSKKCSIIAKNISDSLKEVDIFVLISDKGGTDMFIELGIAIEHWVENKDIKIYAVGKYNDRSLMHHHPAINRVDTLKEVFQRESPELLNEELISFLNTINF